MARRPHPINLLPEAIRYAKTVCRPFERTPCVRNVLTTSSTEVPEDASECVVVRVSAVEHWCAAGDRPLAQLRLPVQSQPAAHASWRSARGAGGGARPRAVLRLREWETPIDDHDGDPFHPRLPALLGDTASQRVIEVRYRAIETQDPCCPRFTHIFPSPIRAVGQHRHPLPPQGRLPRERLPLLLPGGRGSDPLACVRDACSDEAARRRCVPSWSGGGTRRGQGP